MIEMCKRWKFACKFDRVLHLLELVNQPFASTSFFKSLDHLRTGSAGIILVNSLRHTPDFRKVYCPSENMERSFFSIFWLKMRFWANNDKFRSSKNFNFWSDPNDHKNHSVQLLEYFRKKWRRVRRGLRRGPLFLLGPLPVLRWLAERSFTLWK